MAFIPTALLIAGLAVAVIGAGVGTYEAVQSRNRQEEEYAAIEEQKQKEAKAAADSAAYQEQQHRRRIALLAGRQQAVTAAAGVSTVGGTPQAFDIDLATQGELEALNIRRGGQIESEAKTFEARLARYRANTEKGLVPFDIASGVLTATSGATREYSSYYGYNQYRKPQYSGSGAPGETFTSYGARG